MSDRTGEGKRGGQGRCWRCRKVSGELGDKARLIRWMETRWNQQDSKKGYESEETAKDPAVTPHPTRFLPSRGIADPPVGRLRGAGQRL